VSRLDNPDPCPRCHQPTMGHWRPLQAWQAFSSGNAVFSICRACGAQEWRTLADAGITDYRVDYGPKNATAAFVRI
jgi:hypothetical protein